MSTPPATPNINLTCTLHDISGKPVLRGTVTIVLFGFGATLPLIVGTSMLAKVGPVPYSLADGTFDTGLPLWGNDQITPIGQTYYAITIEDEKKNIVQAGIYQFTGGPQTVDLSNAAQLNPNIGIPPLQYLTSDLWVILSSFTAQQKQPLEELLKQLAAQGFPVPARPKPMPELSSMPNGSQTLGAPAGNVYTLTRTPYNGQLIGLFYNGVLLINTLHYTLSGRTITLTFNTTVSDNLYASYVAATLN